MRWGRQISFVLCAAVAQAMAVFGDLPDGRWALTLSHARPQGAGAVMGQEPDEGADDNANDGGEQKKTAAPRAGTGNEAADVEMVLERADGAWIPLFSAKDRICGLLESVEKDGTLNVLVLFDAMGRSNNLFKGPGVTSLIAYRLSLQAAADGQVTGEWSGKAGGRGPVVGRVMPLPRTARPAPGPGEHPRFLLRADEMAALKTRAATPWGQSLIPYLDRKTWSRGGWAVGLGLLYRVTGDKAHARRAQELVLQDIRSGWWDIIGPVHDPPHKVMEAVYTWDLIHDAADPEFHRRLSSLLRRYMRFLESFCDMDRGNGHPHSNWSAQFQSGVGMAALGLMADKSDYVEPDPEAGIPALTPPAEGVPEGLPVLPYDGDGRQITSWLVAGPFDIGLGHDGLAAIGGVAKAKVYDGLRFPIMVKEKESKEVNDKDGVHYINQKNAKSFHWYQIRGDDLQPLTRQTEGFFRKFPAQWICSSNTYAGAPGYMDLRIASGYRSYRTFYLAAALQVPEPVTVVVRFQNQQRDDPCVYIAGRKFIVNDMVRLAPGVYPVMHPVTYTTFLGSHGRDEAIYHGFGLTRALPEQERKLVNHRKAVFEFTKRCRETLAGTPYADFWPRLWLASARAKMDAWVCHAMSERGWNIAGDCYTLPSLQALAPFAHAYANAMGASLGSPGNLGWVLPQEVARTVFAEDRAFTPSYGRGGGPFGPMYYARCFSFVEPALRPAVGWAAHRTLKLAAAGKLTAPEGINDELDPMSAAFALHLWPGPEEVRSPQGILPLTIADRQRCAWTFRNRYQDGDDAVAMLAGFIHPGGDWGDVVSGEFRLAALGNEWAVRGSLGGDPSNVARMATDLVQTLRTRSPVYRESTRRNPDDAVSVTLDLLPLLKKNDARETFGAPIGSRSFLVDWSGTCGAPALVVVQDRFPPIPKRPPKTQADVIEDVMKTGPAKDDDANEDLLPAFARKRPPPGPYDPPLETNSLHRWQFVTDAAHQVTLRPDGFSLVASNHATLNATVLRPAPVRLWQESLKIPTEINYRYDHRGANLPRTAIHVGGDGSYLVVLTVQQGPAPKATLSGDTVAVGGRRIRVLLDGLEMVP